MIHYQSLSCTVFVCCCYTAEVWCANRHWAQTRTQIEWATHWDNQQVLYVGLTSLLVVSVTPKISTYQVNAVETYLSNPMQHTVVCIWCTESWKARGSFVNCIYIMIVWYYRTFRAWLIFYQKSVLLFEHISLLVAAAGTYYFYY